MHAEVEYRIRLALSANQVVIAYDDQLLLQLLDRIDDIDGVEVAWLAPVDVEYLHGILHHALQIDW